MTSPTSHRIVLTLNCPHCGYNVTPLENPHADTRLTDSNGYMTSCMSCGEPFVVSEDDMHEAQHQLLVLLGEA